MKGKTLFMLLVVAAIFIPAHAQTWWHYKEATVEQLDNAGTGYQIRITAHFGSGTDSGAHVYLNGNCRTDFGDVRFFEGNNPLDYWMESMTSGDNAVFWVELDSNLSSGNILLKVSYGNLGATSTSNGDNTFIFFDDFSGDLSKWNRHRTNGVYPQIENSGDEYYARCGGGAQSPVSGPTAYGHTVLGSSASYSGFQNNAIEYRYRISSTSISEVSFRANYSNNTGYKVRSDGRGSGGQAIMIYPYVYDPPTIWEFVSNVAGGVPSANTWYRGTVTAYGSELQFYRNGTNTNTAANSVFSGPGEISLQNHYGTYSDYDWVAVRKFAGAEPVITYWSIEETLPVELSSFTATFTANNLVQLHWVTQSETDALGFMVYRSEDNSIGHAIQVSPLIQATNTSQTMSYVYVDAEVTAGTWYYWLQMIDMSGTHNFHGPVVITVSDGNGQVTPDIPVNVGITSIYPNPFNPSVTIAYTLETPANVKLHIYNTRGQMVESFDLGYQDATNQSLVWDAKNLPAGIYLFRMQAGNEIYASKAVLSK